MGLDSVAEDTAMTLLTRLAWLGGWTAVALVSFPGPVPAQSGAAGYRRGGVAVGPDREAAGYARGGAAAGPYGAAAGYSRGGAVEGPSGSGYARGRGGAVVGPHGGAAAGRSHSGSYTTDRGGTVTYGSAGGAARGPGGGAAAGRVGGVQVETAGGHNYTNVSRGGARSGREGVAMAGSSRRTAVSGPYGGAASSPAPGSVSVVDLAARPCWEGRRTTDV